VPVTATIDLAALRHNARVLQRQAGAADLMAVVKADAYGHGAVPVARALRAEGVRHFAVARPAEGIELRNAGIDDVILVLGAPLPAQVPAYAAHDLDVTVSSPEVADAVIDAASPGRPLRAHVKIDTGMGRIGLDPETAPSVVRRLDGAPGVVLAGLWTHFATADEPGSPFAQVQMDRFEEALTAIEATAERIHTANTGALFTLGARTADRPAALVRSGIALYGLAASPNLAGLAEAAPLQPVMSLTATVTHVNTLPEGATVSYGATWTAPAPTRIATLGVGYGDGYPRLGSGRAEVGIGGERRPVVGTICMDMCMVDLGPPDSDLARRVDVGDRAVLFGAPPAGADAGAGAPAANDPGACPTTYEVANWAETIPYEICCGISPRVPRRYVNDGGENAGMLPPGDGPTAV
jgi:alanine racemase